MTVKRTQTGSDQVRVYLDSIGCRLNQSEMEYLARQLVAGGARLVGKAQDSDLVVVNTCTVTARAAARSRSNARKLGRLQRQSNVMLTGCWATVDGARAEKLEGVSAVVPNARKNSMAQEILGDRASEFDLEPVARVPLPGARARTRAFVKAQDGCNHACTYCQTTIARGPSRSMPSEAVIDQVNAAVLAGAQEAVLSGVQLSSYGRDLSPELSLVDLVSAVLVETDIARLRLSSLEPWGLPKGFFRLWEDHRVCRQLHLPLQSGSRATLRRMARPITPGEFRALVQEARVAVPGLAVTTDLILGFPGETELEARESLDFIEEIGFADAHIFPYSPRPGTAAGRLGDPVPSQTAKERAQQAREIVERSAKEFRTQFLEQELPVLWESVVGADRSGFVHQGWSDNYIRVEAHSPHSVWNTISNVRIVEGREGLLAGRILAD